jgi:hypothetical protein
VSAPGARSAAAGVGPSTNEAEPLPDSTGAGAVTAKSVSTPSFRTRIVSRICCPVLYDPRSVDSVVINGSVDIVCRFGLVIKESRGPSFPDETSTPPTGSRA